MNSLELLTRLKNLEYELSELGDGTAALISLQTGKIITLNKVATHLVSSLYEPGHISMSREDFIAEQSARIARLYDIPAETVSLDVTAFIDKLVQSTQ